MYEIRNLLFNLTSSTLAAIVADLDDHDDMIEYHQMAAKMGYDLSGVDEFVNEIQLARRKRDGGNSQRDEDESAPISWPAGSHILAQQGR